MTQKELYGYLIEAKNENYATFNYSKCAKKKAEKELYEQQADIIKRMQKKYRVEIKTLSDSLLKPFMSPHDKDFVQDAPINIYEQTLKLLYYYCAESNGHSEDIEEMVFYINHALSYIQEDALINNKEINALEIDTVLSDETKTVLFYYVITYSDNTLFRLCRQAKLFNWHKPSDELFLWVVYLICKGNRKITKQSSDYNLWTIDNGNDDLMKSNNYLEMVEFLKTNSKT